MPLLIPPTLAMMNPEGVKQALGIVITGTLIGGLLAAAVLFTLRNLCKIYEKAGHARWKALIPFYQHVIYCRIAGLSGWWALLLLLWALPGPLKALGILIYFGWWIWANIRLARRFGKNIGFGLGLSVPFLDFYFRLVLAEDQSTYDNSMTQM